LRNCNDVGVHGTLKLENRDLKFDEFVKNRIHQVLGVKFYVLG